MFCRVRTRGNVADGFGAPERSGRQCIDLDGVSPIRCDMRLAGCEHVHGGTVRTSRCDNAFRRGRSRPFLESEIFVNTPIINPETSDNSDISNAGFSGAAFSGDGQITGDASAPLIRRNDYSVLSPPALGQWEPTLSVSVVIPAHNHQDKLDLVLAALAAQTYPDHLTEVVIIDDASNPPLILPPITPKNTRLITPDPGGWGSAHAVNTGAAHTDGTVILRLDADMLTFKHHIEAHMRWHHQCDYAAVIGHKRFVDHTPGTHTPQHTHNTVQENKAQTLFAGKPQERQWIEGVIESTDGLRTADCSEAYRVFVGASGSIHRSLFNTAGGMDSTMALGGDTEFGYRLAQAGAVFIPDDTTSSWHLGRSQMQSHREAGIRYRTPFVANRVPGFARRRDVVGHRWEVPFVDVVIEVGDASVEQVETSAGSLLRGAVPDIRVTLVGDWPDPHQRHNTLDDPHVERRLIHETYRSDQRVHFTNTTPPPDQHTPYRLLAPVEVRMRPDALRVLTTAIDAHQAGLVEVTFPDGRTVRLERHAAFARARHVDGEDSDRIDSLVKASYGILRIPPNRIARRGGGSADQSLFNPGKPSPARRLARRFLPRSLRHSIRRRIS